MTSDTALMQERTVDQEGEAWQKAGVKGCAIQLATVYPYICSGLEGGGLAFYCVKA